MGNLRIGTDNYLKFSGELDSYNELCVSLIGDVLENDVWMTKQDAERLIAHLQQAFNIGDKQDDLP